VKVQDVSVYGTSEGFRERANPGPSVFVDAAWEYSVTRHWVVALDATYRRQDNTRVIGYRITDPTQPIRLNSGTTLSGCSGDRMQLEPEPRRAPRCARDPGRTEHCFDDHTRAGSEFCPLIRRGHSSRMKSERLERKCLCDRCHHRPHKLRRYRRSPHAAYSEYA